MITGIEGIPGSGKSYEAVAFHVLPALQAGRKIITNLPLNIEAFAAIDSNYVNLIEIKHAPSPIKGKWDVSNIVEHPAFQLFEDGHTDKQPDSVFTFGTVWDYYDNWRASDGRGPLYIIDECHVSLPKLGTSSQIVEWFKLHRHYNCDVVLLTQSFRDINQSIAQLVATLIVCRKADILGKTDYYIRKVKAGYRGAVIQQGQRKYKSQYFGLYTSHTQGLSLEESKAQDVSPFIVKFNRIKWIVLAFGIVFLIWAFWPKHNTNAFGHRKVQHVKTNSNYPALLPRSASASVVPLSVASGALSASSAVEQAKTAAVGLNSDKDYSFGPLGDKVVSITGMITSKKASLVVLSVSDGSSQLFTVTSDELERSGYSFELFGYCFGWLKYHDKRRPVLCDAPIMQPGTQDRPITYDSGTRQWSNGTGRPPAGVGLASAMPVVGR